MTRQQLVIPYNIAEAAIKQNRVNQISTYFVLSSLYEGRVIVNFPMRLKEISSINGTTKRTLKSHVNQLIQDGLAVVEGKNLRLFGKEKLCEFFNVDNRTWYYKHVFDLQYNNLGVKLLLRALSIKENTIKQRHLIEDRKSKLKAKKSVKSIPPKNTEPSGDEPFVNPKNDKVEIGQRGIAKLYNLKWASSGHYHLKKLNDYGFVKVTPTDSKFICYGDRFSLRALRDLNPKGAYFRSNQGVIFQRQCNKISFTF